MNAPRHGLIVVLLGLPAWLGYLVLVSLSRSAWSGPGVMFAIGLVIGVLLGELVATVFWAAISVSHYRGGEL